MSIFFLLLFRNIHYTKMIYNGYFIYLRITLFTMTNQQEIITTNTIIQNQEPVVCQLDFYVDGTISFFERLCSCIETITKLLTRYRDTNIILNNIYIGIHIYDIGLDCTCSEIDNLQSNIKKWVMDILKSSNEELLSDDLDDYIDLSMVTHTIYLVLLDILQKSESFVNPIIYVEAIPIGHIPPKRRSVIHVPPVA